MVEWLPDRDSNPDKQIQNLSCYHYTIGQHRILPFGSFGKWHDQLSRLILSSGETGLKWEFWYPKQTDTPTVFPPGAL